MQIKWVGRFFPDAPRVLLGGLAFVAAVVATPAAGQELSAAHKRCLARAPSMVDMGDCASQELAREKALLNANYAIATRQADAGDKALLAAAQRAWLAFREANCGAKQIKNGSGAGLSYVSCQIEMTRARRLELVDFFAF